MYAIFPGWCFMWRPSARSRTFLSTSTYVRTIRPKYYSVACIYFRLRQQGMSIANRRLPSITNMPTARAMVRSTPLFPHTSHRTWYTPTPPTTLRTFSQRLRGYPSLPRRLLQDAATQRGSRGQPTARVSLQLAPRELARMRAVDISIINNETRSAETARYRRALPFLGRAWQDMVLTRAAQAQLAAAGDRAVVVPTAAAARADVLRLKRRGELATEVGFIRCMHTDWCHACVVLAIVYSSTCRGDAIGCTYVMYCDCAHFLFVVVRLSADHEACDSVNPPAPPAQPSSVCYTRV